MNVTNSGRHIVSCGSYEGSLLGWTFNVTTNTISSKFTVNDHAAHISAITTCRKFIVSGSADENIRIYSGKKFYSLGSVVQHTDTITCLHFSPMGCHLISGARNGKIIIYRTKFWLNTDLKGHKKCVNDVCLHNNNTLAISVGMDRRLITWNFVSGRTVDTIVFQDVPNICRYSPSCAMIAVAFDRKLITIVGTGKSQEPVFLYTSPHIIHCMRYVNESFIVIGTENKEVIIINALDGTVVCSQSEHVARVRGVAAVPNGDETYSVFSCDSTGRLCVWNLDPKAQTDLLNSTRTTPRQDATQDATKTKKKKKKRTLSEMDHHMEEAASPPNTVADFDVKPILRLLCTTSVDLRLTCLDAYHWEPPVRK